ncbi:ORF1286 [White spot syndrome virus]|uniref:Wsv522 n=3 Tax=White spot syndrome virus TaxID=342409 RepID=Q8VAA4_WSSVS|nr:wsv522 [Shrimp white spot syndrome virus]AFX59883.1 wsv522 [White spot syndrome virus]AAL33523.1 wsv522 [Shrimp white spot syndrome virus]AAL88915.1 WSSV047 [Shrimp white spot syndrome virus]ATU83839.1 ORF1286 [White spot syndrome virus]AWQ61055.1 wsv522 [Shrimp white spot syndrome virus]
MTPVLNDNAPLLRENPVLADVEHNTSTFLAIMDFIAVLSLSTILYTDVMALGTTDKFLTENAGTLPFMLVASQRTLPALK